MRRAAIFLPVLLRFEPASARQDGWGRLTRLTSGGAELSTSTRLVSGEALFLDFELAGDRFVEIRARVAHVEDDADGQRLAELILTDAPQRRRLAQALTDVLSR